MLRNDPAAKATENTHIVETPACQRALTSAAAPGAGHTAILVMHGMGQQVPFETIDAMVQGLRPDGAPAVPRLVQIGDETLARVEVNIDGREVHVYEAYWAPLTEGLVGIVDVLRFLIDAGTRGLLEGGRSFRRWMFGKSVPLTTGLGTRFLLLISLLVIGALAIIDAAMTVVTFTRLYDKFIGNRGVVWPSPVLLTAMTGVTAVFVGVSVVFGVCLLFAMRRKKVRARSRKIRKAQGHPLLWLGLWTTVIVTIVCGIVLLVLLMFGDSLPLDFLRPFSQRAWVKWGTLFLLAAVAEVSRRVRTLLIQYPGDVAAYIESHKLDRFNTIRKEIKDAVHKVGRAVYSAEAASGGPEYDRILIVGHSLGSVIAYDLVNALINEDLVGVHDLHVLARTKLLLTFGSPLDKTAFLFAAQVSDTTETRDALAATKQPLIQSYDYRPFPWINIFAPADIISGSLDYYDDEPDRPQHVKNIADPRATVPLLAHMEYWINPLMFDQIRQYI